jgi:N-acetylglucosamine-6-sulfatase
VFLLVDDLDETTSSYWEALPQTRRLISDRGLTFTNAFVTDPVCCPARATFLTGKYPHNTGVFDNSPPDGGWEAFVGAAERETVAVRLQDAGYTTAYLGKYLNGYERDPTPPVPPGWDEWFGLADSFLDGYTYEVNHNGTMKSYGSEPDDYQTDVLSAQSVEFLTSAESDDSRPFFLYLNPSAPHANIPPAPRDRDNRFVDDPLPTPPNFNEEDVSDKPTWLRDGVGPLDSSAVDRFTSDHARRLGSLLAVDDMLDTVVKVLEENGELDDTVLVFTSDNGYNLGAHRLPYKMAPYEESIRVPLAIAGPGVRTGTEDRLVTNADFAPTLLNVAGVDRPDDVDGKSMMPLFRSAEGPWRSDFLVEFKGTYNDIYQADTQSDVERLLEGGYGIPYLPSYRALRTERSLYVEWYSGDRHEYELYDLAADPFQLDNLLATQDGADEHATETGRLQARLEKLAVCSGRSCRS